MKKSIVVDSALIVKFSLFNMQIFVLNSNLLKKETNIFENVFL